MKGDAVLITGHLKALTGFLQSARLETAIVHNEATLEATDDTDSLQYACYLFTYLDLSDFYQNFTRWRCSLGNVRL